MDKAGKFCKHFLDCNKQGGFCVYSFNIKAHPGNKLPQS